jgi:hypothetical protein
MLDEGNATGGNAMQQDDPVDVLSESAIPRLWTSETASRR